MIIAGSCWAMHSLLARASKLSRSVPETQLLYQVSVSVPFILVVVMLKGDLLREPIMLIWGIFTFKMLVVVAIGFLSWFWLLTLYAVRELTVFTFLAPAFGVLSGWLILNEEFTLALFLALLLVAAGILLVNFKSRGFPARPKRGARGMTQWALQYKTDPVRITRSRVMRLRLKSCLLKRSTGLVSSGEAHG